MSEPIPQPLDPRVKTLWRISGSLLVSVLFGVPAVVCALIARAEVGLSTPWRIAAIALGVVWVLSLLSCLTFVPAIRHARWRYLVEKDYLHLQHGIIWRTQLTVPFIRVQDTSTSSGPLDRLFGLAGVTVSTASEEHKIPGLSMKTAEELRDRAAELTRLAREDV